MKKGILIISTIFGIISLMACGQVNRGSAVVDQEKEIPQEAVYVEDELAKNFDQGPFSDLIYNIDSRFGHTVSKEKLSRAKSIDEILPEKATESVEIYEKVKVAILENKNPRIEVASEMGEDGNFNAAQFKLLNTTNYSTEVYVRAFYKMCNAFSEKLQDGRITYYISIVPENEAEYVGGMEALIDYLKEGSKEKTAIIRKHKLEPGRVSFIVTKNGTVANVELNATSGYPTVDETLVELITNMPGKWKPATNGKGEKVDQEYIFFFGLEGC